MFRASLFVVLSLSVVVTAQVKEPEAGRATVAAPADMQPLPDNELWPIGSV